MQEELIYKFQINLYSSNGQLFKSILCDHWEFPQDEEIMNAIKDNGADYAEVCRIYVVDTIPFTEED